jgi:hypothetical protein
MTFNVHYTHHADLDSSFVDEAWYDDTRHRLVLNLNGVIYEYYDVQKAVYDDLVSAPSAGTFYRKNIQGARKGNRLGYEWEVREVEAERVTTQVTNTFNPNEVHFHNGGVIRRDGYAEFPSISKVGEVAVKASAVTPGVLTDATKIGKLSLAKDVEKKVADTFDYTLQFVIEGDEGDSDERSHTLKAANLDEAIESFLDLANLLDQAVRLKGASVRFE